MIQYIEGDIFKSPAQVIVNTVNTVGVMGKGIALEYKKRYPKMFESYRTACEKHQLKVGKLMIHYAPDHWILSFPTKEHWRNPSKLEYIDQGLKKFVSTYADKHITSIAFPKLGCGNGELDWNDVRPLMESYLKDLPIDVLIYLRSDDAVVPEHKKQRETADWLKKHAKDLSFNGLKDELALDYSIVPFEFADKNEDWEFVWKNGMIFNLKGGVGTIQLDEESLKVLWEQIREKGVVFDDGEERITQIAYASLEALGYLSKVKIIKNSQYHNGYQVNEGVGRVFDLKEI